MKTGFWLNTLALIVFFVSYNPGTRGNLNILSEFDVKHLSPNEYFPDNSDKTMIYDSDFGVVELNEHKDNGLNTFSLMGDDFIYSQKLLINEEGVFVKEVYQKMKVLLFINKEETFNYTELFPRIKFPLKPGNTWKWVGTELKEDEKNTINLDAKVISFDSINVPYGNFQAIKVVTNISSTSGTKSTVTEWYARGIGLVKMVANLNGGGLIGIMRDILGYGELVFELKAIK